MIQKKICLLGSFAVGKTSLVSRLVHGRFLASYVTTVGVKIDKWLLNLGTREVALVIWDLAGEDEFVRSRDTYFRGASGYLLVVDGTRRSTLDVAHALRDRIRRTAGPLPYVVILNKSDLEDQWEITQEDIDSLAREARAVVRASAKSGDNVEEAFRLLAAEVLKA